MMLTFWEASSTRGLGFLFGFLVSCDARESNDAHWPFFFFFVSLLTDSASLELVDRASDWVITPSPARPILGRVV